jgi:PAS domain S-box-containing protein
MMRHPLPRPRGYLVAVAGVALATLARAAATPVLRDRDAFYCFLGAVLVTGWAADAGAGLLALALGAAAAFACILGPLGGTAAADPAQLVGLGQYLVVGGLGLALSAAGRRARPREAPREPHPLLEELTEAMPTIAFMSGPDGVPQYVNRRWTEYTGLDLAASRLDRGLLDVIHPDDRAGMLAAWGHSLETGTEYEAQLRLRRDADGAYRWFLSRAVPMRDAAGAVVRWFGTSTDIEEQKRSEESLRRGEAEYRSLFENAGVGNAEIDPETGRFLRVNRRYCEMTGYGADELLGMTFLDVNHPDDRAATRERIEPFLRERVEGFEHEKRFLRKDGSTIWVQVIGTHIRDAEGRPTRMLGCARDVTARRRIEQELRDADRRKDEFLAMLAHELRNPLAPIRNALGMLGLADDDPATRRWAGEVIDRQVRHLTSLVDDLLDVARTAQGQVALPRTPVAVAALVGSAVESSRPLIDARRHHLAVDLPAEVLHVEGDATRLAQVVLNLLNNAAKYTPEGGHIRLSVAAEDGAVVLRVADDGEGIAPELLPRVFDLFTQASRTPDRTQGGLGIGLTLVRRLVELHGGTVAARSAGPGRGAEFLVRLPRLATAPPAADTLPLAPAVPSTPAHARRVLVVDDNRDTADTLGRLLRRLGHAVAVAYDGPDALGTVAAFGPDLVLLDIGLPGLDGYEVARRLRGDPALDGVSLIALTGYGGESDRRKGVEAGFDDHLVKPVEIEQLRRVLAPQPVASG